LRPPPLRSFAAAVTPISNLHAQDDILGDLVPREHT
jgi:hypothetical protein